MHRAHRAGLKNQGESDIKVNRAFAVPKTRFGEGRGKAQHQKQNVLTKTPSAALGDLHGPSLTGCQKRHGEERNGAAAAPNQDGLAAGVPRHRERATEPR